MIIVYRTIPYKLALLYMRYTRLHGFKREWLSLIRRPTPRVNYYNMPAVLRTGASENAPTENSTKSAHTG